ncbi:MAG: glycosyltransferase family 39 protein [Desulfocapsaceae bacterium]
MNRTPPSVFLDLAIIDWSVFLRSTVLALVVSIPLYVFLRFTGVPLLAAHPAALAGACPIIFLLLRRAGSGGKIDQKITLSLFFRFLVAFTIAASLQGAVLGHLLSINSLPEYLRIVPAAFTGVLILNLILALWVFPPPGSNAVRMQTSVSILCAAMVVLRFAYLGLPELMEQEAYYWNYAQHPALSYLDHPPMVAVLIWMGTKLWGVSEFGVRFAAFLCWLVTAFFSYQLSVKVFDRQAAAGAAFLLATLPLYFGVGFLMTPDAPLHAAWSALLYFGYRALIENDSTSWAGIGISLGLGLLSKYTIVLLGPPFLLFMLIDRRARRWFFRPGPYWALLLTLVLFSPVLIWNMQHEWVSFLFQSAKRISSDPVISTPALIGHITLMLTPAGVIGALLFFLFGKKIFRSAQTHEEADSRRNLDRTYLLLVLLALLPFALFFSISFTREVKLNWTSPIWLAVLPFLGCTVTSVYGRFCSICLMAVHELWRLTLPLLIMVFAVALHYVTLGLPGVPHPPGPFLIGWDELAAEVETLADKVESESGERPIVVGMDHYQITSGLAFYRTKNAHNKGLSNKSAGRNESVGWHLFGYNSRMYQMWFDAKDWQPVDVIAVASKKSRLEKSSFKSEVVFDSEILPLNARKEGQEVRRFYYRLISADSFGGK